VLLAEACLYGENWKPVGRLLSVVYVVLERM
jgi:hypothetical protein